MMEKRRTTAANNTMIDAKNREPLNQIYEDAAAYFAVAPCAPCYEAGGLIVPNLTFFDD